jgi:hypothetical protein
VVFDLLHLAKKRTVKVVTSDQLEMRGVRKVANDKNSSPGP